MSEATGRDVVVPGKLIQIHDPSLRDGHHAVRHNLGPDQLRAYARAADAASVPVVEVGHGNGLGGSSLQVGQARLSDDEMLSVVREALTTSKLGVFMLPGWATVRDIKNAIARGADLVRVGAHCTEASLAERHLGFAREQGADAHGVLLMSHMASPGQLAEECALLVGFGATGVGILDSSGHYLPADVTERIQAIRAAVDVPVMFHGHNNLGMAVANSIAAAEAGADILDACARGFGAGAGNTQLEVLVPVLEPGRGVLRIQDPGPRHLRPRGRRPARCLLRARPAPGGRGPGGPHRGCRARPERRPDRGKP